LNLRDTGLSITGLHQPGSGKRARPYLPGLSVAGGGSGELYN